MTHNYRYSPRNSGLKQLVKSGAIGTPLSVTFEWVLDTAHGADYFRRWHRDKINSGGLLVHKASHHFDLVNWLLADAPAQVYARGGVRFYGAENAAARGVPAAPGPRHPRRAAHARGSSTCAATPTCASSTTTTSPTTATAGTRTCSRPGVTTEDNLAVIVDYERGATLSYALNAHSPWEGYRIAVNGTEGRAELDVVERAAVLLDADGAVLVDPSAQPESSTRPGGQRLTLQRHWEAAQDVPIAEGEGGHGGGDALMLADVFRGPGDDWLERPVDLGGRGPLDRGRDGGQRVAAHRTAGAGRRPRPRGGPDPAPERSRGREPSSERLRPGRPRPPPASPASNAWPPGTNDPR